MADIPGLPARRAALKLCDAVLRRGETLDQAGHAAMQGMREGADRALAIAIASEVLRWLADLDALIDSATKQRLPEDAKPRAVLRLMLAQWLRLETPPHAVIATCLPLLAGGPRRLAHGVFGALTRKGVTLPEYPTLPEAVAARWGERADAIARGLAEPPPLDLTWHAPVWGNPLYQELGATQAMLGHMRFPRGLRVEDIPGYQNGAWWVQDLAASLPARLLGQANPPSVIDPVEDELIGKSLLRAHALDMCAAPGGKTMQLVNLGWRVTALDKSAKRLELLRANLERGRLHAEIVVADALEWEPAEQFDAILLDAPCTATGTCRRHPDVLHRIGKRQIEEMADLQARLIERAIRWLKPGGTFIYAVCSLEREEGEEQAAKVPLETVPVLPSELPPGLTITPEGWVRTDPGMLPEAGGLDGFFIARWRAVAR